MLGHDLIRFTSIRYRPSVNSSNAFQPLVTHAGVLFLFSKSLWALERMSFRVENPMVQAECALVVKDQVKILDRLSHPESLVQARMLVVGRSIETGT